MKRDLKQHNPTPPRLKTKEGDKREGRNTTSDQSMERLSRLQSELASVVQENAGVLSAVAQALQVRDDRFA